MKRAPWKNVLKKKKHDIYMAESKIVFEWATPERHGKLFRQQFYYFPSGEVFIARRDREIIGFVAFSGENIADFLVKPEFRKKGLAHGIPGGLPKELFENAIEARFKRNPELKTISNFPHLRAADKRKNPKRAKTALKRFYGFAGAQIQGKMIHFHREEFLRKLAERRKRRRI